MFVWWPLPAARSRPFKLIRCCWNSFLKSAEGRDVDFIVSTYKDKFFNKGV
jgi:hypothetical protein